MINSTSQQLTLTELQRITANGNGDAVAVPSPATNNISPLLQPTIFHERWWLEAASDGNYSEAEVFECGKLVGRLPYRIRKEPGRLFCAMPELTHFLGPAIDEGSGNAITRAARRNKITRELLAKVPQTGGFHQTMHGGIKDMLVFQDLDYDVSVMFTYEIEPLSEQVLWWSMRDKTRNVIRRAQEKVIISNQTDPDEFVDFHDSNLIHRGLDNYYSSKILKKVCKEAVSRNRGRVISARNSSGDLSSAIFCINDDHTTYYLVSTRSQDAGDGDISALIWEGIKHSAQNGRVFDFDGIAGHTHSSALLFAGFGGLVKPRFTASRFSLGFRLYEKTIAKMRTKGQKVFTRLSMMREAA